MTRFRVISQSDISDVAGEDIIYEPLNALRVGDVECQRRIGQNVEVMLEEIETNL